MPSSPLFNNLFYSTRNRNIPLLCSFELTRRCNLRCKHCYIEEDRGRRELTTLEIKKILRSLAAAGTMHLIFTGGEVFLRPDFLEIVSYARKLSFDIQIFSNGTLITPADAKALADLYVSGIELSLYGRETTHDVITRKPGSFLKTVETIGLLKRHRIPVTIKTPLMRMNFNDYRWLQRFARQNKITVKFDPTLAPKDNGNKAILRYRLNDKQLLEVYRTMAAKTSPQLSPSSPKNDEDIFCGAGHNLIAIGCDGMLYPCLQVPLPLGNLRSAPLSRLWGKQNQLLHRYRSIKFSDLQTCSSCSSLSSCQRCPGLALLEDGSLLGPSSIACHIQKISKMSVCDLNHI